ncbi:M23 family metallopeptidase [Methanohalophilus portucalensis]|uniref:M23 family metallopeptidase n=2 Tax=Methanohalophilus portucalensis TaxID=39664 RepID=A0A1L9C5P8_9EURY|nr:M23 family metallopeptidase [Methanohalophilus portucalensis]ATU08499.1 metalloendopeptidase [Methanohalophilus portucalensis]OJH49855.1 peptidase M23 [Methanohalophilus portucalensis FDF-1]RNI13332.1 M23 family metallopeptidase [Methanohalophilus portucalensis FDF-1]SMH33421.1 Peptidase family M23 [Methanohalophilus portucalensis FDF-1]
MEKRDEKNWPLPVSVHIPDDGDAGCFWEDREDRHHCGIDLYAEKGTPIFAIEEGEVVEIGIMTSPSMIGYWNKTYHLIVRGNSGIYYKYGEMGMTIPEKGSRVKKYDRIGEVGQVLNTEMIDNTSPKYIQALKEKNPAMLHLEIWGKYPVTDHKLYLGGNWFGSKKPPGLLDPLHYLHK